MSGMMDASVANWWCIFSRRFLSAMTCSFTLEPGFRPPLLIFFSVVDDEQHFPTMLPVATGEPAVKEIMSLSLPPALTTIGQLPSALLRWRSPTNEKPAGDGMHC